MRTFDLQNLRVLKVTFVAPTNSRGARIKIYEEKRYNDDKTKSKIFSYDYQTGDVLQQALNILLDNGWNPVCRGSEFNNYFIMCDNWGEDFKEITDLK